MKIKFEESDNKIKIKIFNGTIPLTNSEFLNLCSTHKKFPEHFLKVFGKIPFSSYRWEHPKLERDSLSKPYESVFISSPLSDTPDINAFREHFTEDLVVNFSNLSGDSLLIVPTPIGNSNYSHLKNFIKNSSKPQKIEFIQTLGREVLKTLETRHV